MIKKLTLKKFGRFSEKTFSFAPVTLFFGHNEAGKTTIFDALLDTVSSPKATTKPGIKLNARYGKDRKANLEQTGELFSITPEDFLNLFAIRSGDLNLEIDKNSEWMNQVKASLFSGGIDPESVVSRLGKIIKDQTKNSINAEEKRITQEIEEQTEEKKKAEQIRQNCLTEEKQIKNSKNKITENVNVISNLEKTNTEIEESLIQQDLLQQEKSYKFSLNNISEIKQISYEKEKYSRFSVNVLNTLKEKEKELQELKNTLNKALVLETEIQRELFSAREEKIRIENKKIDLDSKRTIAESLRETLLPREKFLQKKTRRVVRKLFIAISSFLFIAGIVLLFFSPFSFIFSISVFGAAIVSFLFAFAKVTYEDNSLLDEAVKLSKEKWKKETGEDLAENYEELLSGFSLVAERSRATTEDLKRIITRAAELEIEENERLKQKREAESLAETTQRQLRTLLDEFGTTNIDDFITKLEKNKNLTDNYENLRNKIKNELTTYGLSSISDLENTLRNKLSEINGKITESELSENELRAKRNLLQSNKLKLETLRHEDKHNFGSLKENLGTIRGQLQGLPEKIASCEKNILEKEERLSEIKKQQRATVIAKELFASLADDSSIKLEQLSSEIGKVFSSLTTKDREVTMPSYSIDSVNITDALGSERNNVFLSAGTRDAFFLAARLVLAKKSLNENKSAVVVLDEPFLTLDKPRTIKALSVLKEFQKETNWQIVLFTKDEETEKETSAIFKDNICVYRLESSI